MDIVLGKKENFEKMSKILNLELLYAEKNKEDFVFDNCVIALMNETIPKADFVYGLELSQRNDFLHQRNSGLNHILAKQLNEKDIVVCFGLSYALDGTILGRMRQNVKLCRKYKVKMIYVSLASDEFGLRSEHDLQYFAKAIGFNSLEIKNKNKIIKDKLIYCKKKKEGKIIAKGIEMVD
jgi:hypothetical protein